MQTFLPYENFTLSAQHLDSKRLAKQRVENLQIMKALTLPQYGWKNHPAVKMWEGFEWSLWNYHEAIYMEWIGRGGADTTFGKLNDVYYNFLHTTAGPVVCDSPMWLGNENFHASHRSNLLRKDPEWYGQFGWTEPADLPYWWPTKEMINV